MNIRFLGPVLVAHCLVSCAEPSEPPACGDACPAGTNQVDLDFQGTIVEGTLAVESKGCLAFCEPIFRCDFPSVPVIDDRGAVCQLLDGYTTIGPASEVDTSFGLLWRVLDPAIETQVAGGWTLIAFGDLDGDQAADAVAVMNYEIRVLYANGDGSFDPTPVPTGIVDYLATQLLVGDFTGDGLGDVAIESGGAIVADRSLWVYAGDGLGGFGAGTLVDPAMAGLVVAADFDGDGREDLLTSQDGGSVFFSDGGGAFTEVALPSAPWGVQQVTYIPADFDGDGLLDLAVSGEGGSVFRNDGSRGFLTALTNASGLGGLAGIAALNVDADPADELLVWDASLGRFAAYDMAAGFSATGVEVASEVSGFWPRRCDIDADGWADSVGTSNLGIGMLLSADGTPYYSPRDGTQGTVGGAWDVDGDGLCEAVHASAQYGLGTIAVVAP